MSGWAEQVRSYALDVTLSGPPQTPFMTFADDRDFPWSNEWAGTTASGGAGRA